MSYLTERLTIEHISSQKSKNSIVAGYGRILGREYAKKCLIFSEICYSEKLSGQTFDSYNFSIECSI